MLNNSCGLLWERTSFQSPVLDKYEEKLIIINNRGLIIYFLANEGNEIMYTENW
jgi:hypothetical protein